MERELLVVPEGGICEEMRGYVTSKRKGDREQAVGSTRFAFSCHVQMNMVMLTFLNHTFSSHSTIHPTISSQTLSPPSPSLPVK